MAIEKAPLLDVSHLSMYYRVGPSFVKAVNDVSFTVRSATSLGVVGESGCGKSSLAWALLRLLPKNGVYTGGDVKWKGTDLLKLPAKDMSALRWKEIAMVFQGAMNSLNPVMTVGAQMIEALREHADVTKDQALSKARDLLEIVGLHGQILNRYPHELSGGMKQRVVIGMALMCDPGLLIADEPTTALDVIAQDQVMRVIDSLQERLGIALLVISHDIALIAESCQDVLVMYAGHVVESGQAQLVFGEPLHPYTSGLLSSFPNLDGEKQNVRGIPGEPADLLHPPEGCSFWPRCAQATERCRRESPPIATDGGRSVACWLHVS